MEYPVKTVCVVGLGYIGLPTRWYAARCARCPTEQGRK
jgi:UDP-N-acetyl-D-mannosaminuronate dehydrogenase